MSVIVKFNNQIRAKEVRLINQEGEMLGVTPTEEALNLAKQAGLDLIEISPNASPPVCKIADYGKFKYEKEKKERQNKKSSKALSVKEIVFSPKIGRGDYETKLNHLKDFLEKGYQVKVSSKIRGRDWGLESRVFQMFDEIKSSIEEVATIQEQPKKIANGVFMVVIGKK